MPIGQQHAPKLKPRARKGVEGSIVTCTVAGSASNWKTLDDLTVAVDPRVLLSAPDKRPLSLFALESALIAAVTSGVSSLPLWQLSRICKIPQREMLASLRTIHRETGRVDADVKDKVVTIGKPQARIMRPDLYWRIPISKLVQMDDVQNLRAYLLVAIAAASGSVLKRKPSIHFFNAEIASYLALPVGTHGTKALEDRLPWLQKQFEGFDVEIGRTGHGCNIKVEARKVDTDKFNPDNVRLAYMGDTRRDYLIADGVIKGHDLTVQPVLAAKAWTYAKQQYRLDAPFREIRWLWLSAVTAWSHDLETTMRFWPSSNFDRLLADGENATSTFVKFTMAVGEASAQPKNKRLCGPSFRVFEASGRDLERLRRARRAATKRGNPEGALVCIHENARVTAGVWRARTASITNDLLAAGYEQDYIDYSISEKAREFGIPTIDVVATDGAPVGRVERGDYAKLSESAWIEGVYDLEIHTDEDKLSDEEKLIQVQAFQAVMKMVIREAASATKAEWNAAKGGTIFQQVATLVERKVFKLGRTPKFEEAFELMNWYQQDAAALASYATMAWNNGVVAVRAAKSRKRRAA